MLKQIQKLQLILAVFILFSGFESSRILPEMHDIYTKNLTTENEIWEHITRGTANYNVRLHYLQGEFYVANQIVENRMYHFPTFRNTYLFPLFSQFKKNNHEIFSGFKDEITLFVNIQGFNSKALNTLKRQLYPYSEMLSYRKNGIAHRGKIRIILTNDQLEIRMQNNDEWFWWLQGDLNDLNENSPDIPVICIKLNEITSWSESGNLPLEDFMRLKELANKTHLLGKKIRIENIPDHPRLKKTLLKAGVDYFDTQNPLQKEQLVFKPSEE